MGVNNKARRAAKKRKRGRGAGIGPSGDAFGGGFSSGFGRSSGFAARVEHDLAHELVAGAVAACADDPGLAGRLARDLTNPDAVVSPAVLADALRARLDTMLRLAADHGWSPRDLGEITRRRLDTQSQPLLAARLAALTDGHPVDRVADAWRAELLDLGGTCHPSLRSRPGLALGIGLAGVLATLPRVECLLPPPGSADRFTAAPGADGRDVKMLARVRALLAKAESTDFREEAESLSAKAQELISRHALDRLAATATGDDGAGRPAAVVARRLWLDAPYVLPKAMLVHEVAEANRCSSVVAERLGFVTLVGAAADLDAVEALVTSLLVQASAALLRAGRQVGRDGTSRTTSFRRSFLISYATQIGERLREADSAAVAGSADAGALVPLVRDQRDRVAAAVDEMFPELRHRDVAVSNAAGWAEGRAAADLALFDTHLEVSRAAS